MAAYQDRSYRRRVRARDMVSFEVAVKETDLWICASRDLTQESRDLVFDCRHQLEAYIDAHPGFVTSLSPWEPDPYAPPMVREMIEVTRDLKVGPMASVAGAIAQCVGRGLLELSDEVIVENGGDVFLKARRPMTVSVFAGTSPLSERFGVRIPTRQMPLGICSSSATIGHSLSMGVAEVVCLLSHSAPLADGAATALGNRIKGKRDLEKVAQWAQEVTGILGGLAIVEDRLATWGEIELVAL
jgi:ApbE superfamily uncharacterized protein (UPF0280 family)